MQLKIQIKPYQINTNYNKISNIPLKKQHNAYLASQKIIINLLTKSLQIIFQKTLNKNYKKKIHHDVKLF